MSLKHTRTAISQYQYLLYQCRPSCLLLCGWAASLYPSVYTLQALVSSKLLLTIFSTQTVSMCVAMGSSLLWVSSPKQECRPVIVTVWPCYFAFIFFLYHFLLLPQGRFLSLSGPGQNSFWHLCFKDSWQSVRKHWWARDGWPAIKVKSVGVELGTSRLHVSLTGLSQCLEG